MDEIPDAFHETCWVAWSAVRAVGSSGALSSTRPVSVSRIASTEEQQMLDDSPRTGDEDGADAVAHLL
jgi:hypothetical protein